MAVRLRTRLFLVVAVLLGASIVVSALLSRRATLVEVRAVVSESAPALEVATVLERVASTVQRTSLANLPAVLAAFEVETSRHFLVMDEGRGVVSASNAFVATARVTQMTPDGTFSAEFGSGPALSVIQSRGAPVRTVTAADGRSLTVVVLPALGPEEAEPQTPTRGAPLWVWTTLATGIIAVPLVFAVARRILNPITALTDAAHRMQAGDLGVRVDVRGRDELAELACAFNGMAARLAETERLRQQMVSDVAHELRSPVTNLRCTLESIQDGLAIPDRASIDALHDETLFLQRLIADLQDLAMVEAGQLALQIEPLDLREVIRRAASASPAIAGQAPLRLELPDGLPVVHGDGARLEQVFRNLLSNARTNTPADGRIDLSTQVEAGIVRVEVTDTGRGIDPAHVAHVFDRFYRVDASRSRATGGAGLGLAIVRQLVTAHGGTVDAVSEGLGRGARFTVTLPVRG